MAHNESDRSINEGKLVLVNLQHRLTQTGENVLNRADRCQQCGRVGTQSIKQSVLCVPRQDDECQVRFQTSARENVGAASFKPE